MPTEPQSVVQSPALQDNGVHPRTIHPSLDYRFGLSGTGVGFVLPVRTSTGDPASPFEGQMYVNTADNALRVYADGAWRDVISW